VSEGSFSCCNLSCDYTAGFIVISVSQPCEISIPRYNTLHAHTKAHTHFIVNWLEKKKKKKESSEIFVIVFSQK
jgi:hypothetical protein